MNNYWDLEKLSRQLEVWKVWCIMCMCICVNSEYDLGWLHGWMGLAPAVYAVLYFLFDWLDAAQSWMMMNNAEHLKPDDVDDGL